MKSKDFLSITNLEPQEIQETISRASKMAGEATKPVLAGKTVALLFEKPSLRTRVSFEMAVHQLGGYPFYLSPQEVGLGVRETVSDVARVLSRWVDCIVARVYSHSNLEEMARYSSVPVINALSDLEHPCQTLADLQTICEQKGTLEGLKIVFIGDGNNVARSLCLGAASLGASFTIASPPEYSLNVAALELAKRLSKKADIEVKAMVDPREAVSGADVVYTDVWASMGQEAETRERIKAFKGYTVDADLLANAKGDAIFMHDMPVHYGQEVAQGMLEHPQSVVYQQAENRLHVQKALLEMMLG